MRSNEVLQHVADIGIIPVISLEDSANAIELAQALSAGNVPCIEITLRTENALSAIEMIASTLPDIIVGAGTVLDIKSAEKALSAGAKFIVSPGFDDVIVDWCLERDIAIIPGAVTPSEIMAAMKRGIRTIKYFPAEQMGGVAAVKALSAPFPTVRFVVTSGMNLDTIGPYLSLSAVAACGGSWLATNTMIAANDFDKITEVSRRSVEIVRVARNNY
jgi:2-dehydro-3-deoxyphosphogluconate aldolase/(4S)-4-hydroxy-2-oxoglutarate aldolase